MGRDTTRHDLWIVGDDQGVTHRASVMRVYNKEGHLVMVQVATACCSSPRQVSVKFHDRSLYAGGTLPPVQLNDIRVVGYRLRETPSCIRCAATPTVF